MAKVEQTFKIKMIAKMLLVGGIGTCVGKVITSLGSLVIPSDAGKITKIVYRVGLTGITVAVTTAVSKKLEDAFDDIDESVTEIKEQINIVKAMSEEDDEGFEFV